MTEVRKGSAKNTYIEIPPTDLQMGSGQFGWTTDWSVFDYKEFGEFPWRVPYQDVALPIILQKTYEILHSQGVSTCVVGADDDRFQVNLVRVPGYAGFPREPAEIPVGMNNRMIDLEVTFNLAVHPRSSLYGRWREGKLDYKPLGFTRTPQPWEVIPIVKDGRVLFRYTTKFEEGGDRPLSDEEAKERSRLTERQWLQGNDNSTKAALATYRYADRVGLMYGDGKHEWMVDDEGNVRIADLVGNPYDDRFVVRIPSSHQISHYIGLYGDLLNLSSDERQHIVNKALAPFNGSFPYQDVSKQFLRNLYDDNGWRSRWRKEKIPPPTPIEEVQQTTGDMYLSVAQVWNRDVDVSRLAGRKVRPLEDVAAELWVIEELNRMNQLPWTWQELRK